MKRTSWRIPVRGAYRRKPPHTKVVKKALAGSKAYLTAYDDFRRWRHAAAIAVWPLPPDASRKAFDPGVVRFADERLKAVDDEARRRWASVHRKKVVADRELRGIMGFDLVLVQQALQSAVPGPPDVGTCGVLIEAWSATANKSWHLDHPISANADNSHFDVTFDREGVLIQNHYYVPIFPEDSDFQWTCLAADATIRITGLADVRSGGYVLIRATHTMTHYRNQPWNVGRPGALFLPPDEGSPVHRNYCRSSETTDPTTGVHVVPAFTLDASFVSHDVQAGDFFEYIEYVNVIAHGSIVDLTGVGGITLGKPYFRLFGQ
jgi:hypothetical protein